MHTDVYLARAVHRVETLFFKDHGDSQRLQFPRVFQAVNGISGKSGHRLGDYHVDIAFSALTDHFHELRSALRLGAAQSLVYIDSCYDTNTKRHLRGKSAGNGVKWGFLRNMLVFWWEAGKAFHQNI